MSVRQIFFSALCIILGVSGCRSDNKPVKQQEYFDNQTWFDAEIKRLESENPGITKTLEVNGKQETVETSHVNWAEELRLLRDFNIRKSSYSGKFRVDSIFTPGNDILHIRYTSDEKHIPIKLYQVSMIQNRVVGILARKLDHSSLFDSELNWEYIPDSSYSIHGVQNLKGINKGEFLVKGRFKK